MKYPFRKPVNTERKYVEVLGTARKREHKKISSVFDIKTKLPLFEVFTFTTRTIKLADCPMADYRKQKKEYRRAQRAI